MSCLARSRAIGAMTSPHAASLHVPLPSIDLRAMTAAKGDPRRWTPTRPTPLPGTGHQRREPSHRPGGRCRPDRRSARPAVSPMPDDGIWGWAGPLLVTAFAAFFRFYRLSVPHAVVFDETYYVKDAWSILKHGVEWNYIANPAHYPTSQNYANNLMLAGHTNIFAACSGTGCGEYIVQPEIGKYLIAVGEWLFGLHPFGWRVASAFFGTLAVLVMCRVARRMTRSTLLGCVPACCCRWTAWSSS